MYLAYTTRIAMKSPFMSTIMTEHTSYRNIFSQGLELRLELILKSRGLHHFLCSAMLTAPGRHTNDVTL